MFTPPAPPYSSNIGKVKDDEAGMDVDIMEKNDFKKQVEAWRWLKENSGAAWRLEAHLILAPQKIDKLGEKFEDTLDEIECKEKGLKKEKRVINNQTIEITEKKRITKNWVEDQKN